MSKIKAIIPCAGFGTRMNMKPNESKEMLLDDGKPIIKYSLDLCKQYDIEPLIITRPEKQDLIKYVEALGADSIQIEPGKEWPDTVLKSAKHWNDKNILILPDTRFHSTDVIWQIQQSLENGFDIAFAVHTVADTSKWGAVTPHTYCEKPSSKKPGLAWGLIGFERYAGNCLFSNMSERGVTQYHNFPTTFVFLESFVDITRGDKV